MDHGCAPDPENPTSTKARSKFDHGVEKMTKTRNPLAACLSNGAYRPQRVKPSKGKGSFRRADKHRARSFG